MFKTWKIETKYFCSPVRRGWSVRQMPANADLKCCIFWKKSISQVFLNVALSERKVFRALAIGRDWIRENIFVPMQTFMTAEAKTFAGNLFRTSNCGGMEPRMAGCSLGCGHWVCMQEKLSKGGSYMFLTTITTCTTAAVRLTCLQRAAAAAQTFLASAWCSALCCSSERIVCEFRIWELFLSRTGWKALEMQKLV